ncbi:uncharacterized protein FFMR_06558 [Fusarium fujikuroi]|nr:uncharacterized protein FFMR_06558 [Fusarium fujikuroi]
MRGDYKEVLVHVIATLINLIRTGLSRHVTIHEIHMGLISPKFIWHRHMKASNDQYKPLSYRPAIILCPKAPKGDELILSPKMTKEYVDVGLIVGDVPEKHSRKGTPTKGSRHQDPWKGPELWHMPLGEPHNKAKFKQADRIIVLHKLNKSGDDYLRQATTYWEDYVTGSDSYKAMYSGLSACKIDEEVSDQPGFVDSLRGRHSAYSQAGQEAGQEEDQQDAGNTPSTKKIELSVRPRQEHDDSAAIEDDIAGDIHDLLEDSDSKL